MSFQITIGKKPVIFKSGVRMSKQLDKCSNMTIVTEDGQELKHFAGAGSAIIKQFLTVVSSEEVDAGVVLILLSNLLFAMQNEVSQDELDGYLDSIDDEETLNQLVQKVYNELPKVQKKLTSQSEVTTAPTVLP